jgi:hypothetical protein
LRKSKRTQVCYKIDFEENTAKAFDNLDKTAQKGGLP